ncbi:unnamed protein product, partial [Callosobruchus maculatus]
MPSPCGDCKGFSTCSTIKGRIS